MGFIKGIAKMKPFIRDKKLILDMEHATSTEGVIYHIYTWLVARKSARWLSSITTQLRNIVATRPPA